MFDQTAGKVVERAVSARLLGTAIAHPSSRIDGIEHFHRRLLARREDAFGQVAIVQVALYAARPDHRLAAAVARSFAAEATASVTVTDTASALSRPGVLAAPALVARPMRRLGRGDDRRRDDDRLHLWRYDRVAWLAGFAAMPRAWQRVCSRAERRDCARSRAAAMAVRSGRRSPAAKEKSASGLTLSPTMSRARISATMATEEHRPARAEDAGHTSPDSLKAPACIVSE